MSGPASRMRQLLSWLEDRTGLGAGVRRWGQTPLADGPRWGRVPGALLLLLILLQICTGITMAFFYSPGTTTAWGSVFYLEEQVLLGSFVRGLHAFGASAIVICLLIHGLQAGWRRAYRAPRELNWWLGLLLVPLLAGFALTGYLLPWDQKGYWATQVATGIMAGTPLVGKQVATVFQGGPELGNLTLTRFFALHTMVLPVSLLLLIGIHLMVWRRNAARDEPTNPGTPYWPSQAARDLLLAVGVIGLLAVLAGTVGAGLEAPADPDSDYPPRPEWYFAPLRELLKTIPEPWGSVFLPGALFLLLASLPLLDRGDDEKRQKLARAILLLPLAAWLGLLLHTTLADLGDEDFQERRVVADADALEARELARQGIPPDGAGYMLRMHPPRHGRRLFGEHCQKCHKVDGKGGKEASDLTGFGSELWLSSLIRDPDQPKYFGKHEVFKDLEPDDKMPKLPKQLHPRVRALVAYVRSLDPSNAGLDPKLVAQGKKWFKKPYSPATGQSCADCHNTQPYTDAIGANTGPSLHNYGTAEWLLAYLKNPAADRFYHERSKMPAFGKELSEVELKALVVFLRGLREKKQ